MSVRLIEMSPEGEVPIEGSFADETEAHAEAQKRQDTAMREGKKLGAIPRYRIVPA